MSSPASPCSPCSPCSSAPHSNNYQQCQFTHNYGTYNGCSNFEPKREIVQVHVKERATPAEPKGMAYASAFSSALISKWRKQILDCPQYQAKFIQLPVRNIQNVVGKKVRSDWKTVIEWVCVFLKCVYISVCLDLCIYRVCVCVSCSLVCAGLS